MCVRKCPLLTLEFAKKPEHSWSREALSHEAARECNSKSHTGSLGPPMLVGGRVDQPAERPLACLLCRQPVEVALRSLRPPLPPRTLLIVQTMGGGDVLRGRVWKHENVPILPHGSAGIGDTGDHAILGPNPRHHDGLGMWTHTTLTNTHATPCRLLQDPPSNMGQPMVPSPHTAVRPHPPIHTNPFPLHRGTVSSPRRETDRPTPQRLTPNLRLPCSHNPG